MKKSSGFGGVLRYLRQARGLRQRDVAARLEVSPSQIPKWEREHQGIRLESLVAVLEVLGVGMEEFGALLDGVRRGESLVRAGRPKEQRTGEPSRDASAGRLAVLFWEAGADQHPTPLEPSGHAEVERIFRDVRNALDQLRPPEEALEAATERERQS